ncbi:MAG: DUF72 domain-containing protein [Gemmatimonas sp.]
MIYIGTAGWSIPTNANFEFPLVGPHLQRYAARFTGVEINSTFYRSHQTSTFERWADSVPEGFKFSVKIPKAITHEQRLVDVEALVEIFLLQVTALESKLGCVLVQLPPSLVHDYQIARRFFEALRKYFEGAVAFEPRHTSWFANDVERLLSDYRISRVAADPAVVPQAAVPGGYPGFVYMRLHGSPRLYYSAYDEGILAATASVLMAASEHNIDAWCVFDNTASGAAATDALKLSALTSLGR